MKNEVKKLIMGVALVELMLVTALTITSCTDSNASIEAVEAMGMTDVQIIGYSPFSCSNDDFSSTEFSAVNSLGYAFTAYPSSLIILILILPPHRTVLK